MQNGGYRKPSNPSPVSGPGKFSRRTDGGPQSAANLSANGKYGERKALAEMQSGAPMAGNPAPQPSSKPVVDMFQATQMPHEPVTAGAELGAGPGPEILNMPTQSKSVRDVLQRLAMVDETGEIDTIINYLSQKGY